MWKTLLDKFHGGEFEDEPNVSRLLIRNISTEHNNIVVCKADCGSQPSEKTSDINVYSFPQDPVLPKIKSLIANQEQTLSCTIYNVYPLERFKLEWLLGEEYVVIYSDTYPEELYGHKPNYTSVFNYTHSVDNVGKNITCKATLKLKNGFEKTRNSTLEYGPGTITISSNKASVKLGENLEITCQADGNPKPKISWQKQKEADPEHQSKNEKLIINNASWSQAGWYQCNASNYMGSLQKRVEVIVLGPPNTPKIRLSHIGELEEGENITIFCSLDGTPAELTISRQSQNAQTGSQSQSAALLNIPSIQITDAGTYICEAKNDIGIERSTIDIRVKARQSMPDPMPDLPVAIIPAVGSVSLLTAVGLLIRHCRKKARSDSCNLELN
ncbi:vascular cell adhesion protein 1 [Danio aesculapii]|uniref:vascular cell adhesion protein 1 n=1 Tax=Danio aesculapii TaxID=1142201 RepID=UPI0024BF74CB|nr:vascular cell adhesion protein 1 [Danio aesculapii]